MILAAGLGTRFKPWTDQHPKALAIVNGRSLLQRNIEYLQQFGIYDVVVNVHHFADQIIDAIERNKGWGSRVEISDESDAVLETGGGLMKAAPMLMQGGFVLMNVDILTDLDLLAMIDDHQKNKPLATLATTHRQTSRYFLFDASGNLCGWKNTKTGEQKVSKASAEMNAKAFSGIHVIEPEIFKKITQTGKFSMVDVYLSLAATEIIKSFDHSDSKLIDVGKPEAAILAGKLFT